VKNLVINKHYSTSLPCLVKTAKRSSVPTIRAKCATTPTDQRKELLSTTTSNEKNYHLNHSPKATEEIGLTDFLDLIEARYGYSGTIAIALLTFLGGGKNA